MNVRKIAMFAIGPVAGALLGLISLPLVAWLYPAEDVGRLAMLQVALGLCLQVFSFGLDQAYVREYHEYSDRPRLLKTTLLPGLLALLLVLSAFMMAPDFLSRLLFDVSDKTVGHLVAICLLAALVSRFLSLILRMQERGLAFSMGQLLPKLIFVVIILGYYFFSSGKAFTYLVLAQTASIFMVALVYLWATRSDWHSAIGQKLDWPQLRAMLRYGLPLVIGGLAFWGLTMLDRLFLRSFSSFSELGIYSVASSIAAAAMIFQSVFSTVWAPTVYKWASEGIDPQRIDQVTEYVLAVVVFMFCGAGLFSWVVTYFLPPAYRPVEYLLTACMGYPLLYTLSETTVVGLSLARRTGLAMLASVIAVSVSLAGNFLLVPRYGAAGAAVATMTAFWVFLVCRTEFSVLVWRQLVRRKLYALTFVCVFIAVVDALFGKALGTFIGLLWLLLFSSSIWLFKSVISDATSYINSRLLKFKKSGFS